MFILACRIDEEITKKLKDSGSRKSVASGRKYDTELKRLSSSINYEGK